jgi:predicted amidohydrolase
MPIWGGNEALAKARAIENHLFLVTSDYSFPSLFFDPLGFQLARTEQDGTVSTVTVDLNRRYFDPWLGDMRARFFRGLRGDLQVEPTGRK